MLFQLSYHIAQKFINSLINLSAATFQQRRPSLADVVIIASHTQQKQTPKTSAQLAQLASNLKGNFDDVQTEQAIILHDNLELHERFVLDSKSLFSDVRIFIVVFAIF